MNVDLDRDLMLGPEPGGLDPPPGFGDGGRAWLRSIPLGVKNGPAGDRILTRIARMEAEFKADMAKPGAIVRDTPESDAILRAMDELVESGRDWMEKKATVSTDLAAKESYRKALEGRKH